MQNEIAKNATPLGLDEGVYPFAFKICLATIGVAFLSAATSVAALFYLERTLFMHNNQDNIGPMTILLFPAMMGALLLFVAIPFGNLTIIILGVIFIIAPVCLVLIVIRNAVRTQQAMRNFDFDNGILYLKKQGKENATVIDKEQISLTSLQHHDATIEYNSATVGNVTVGGVHINPAYYSAHASDSGRYKLKYCGKEIEAIRLPDNLLIRAKQNPIIANRIHGDCIVCTNTANGYTQTALKRAHQSGSLEKAIFANSIAEIERGITKAEACAIKRWLCSE